MEFEIKGINYRASKLSVFDQLKVSRKLLPVLAGMLGDFQGIKAASQGGDVYKALETALPKIADSLAEMSEEDTNAIIFPCLSVVARQNGKVWAPVMSQNELMFDDIDLMSMLQIVGRVVGD
ncbi:phage tail assembly chaperone, partial [Pantoea ananatis]